MDASAIDRAVVIGGGLMGAGLAHVMAQAGCRVQVVDIGEAQLERCRQRVRASLEAFVKGGWLDDGQVEPILGRISYTSSLDEAVKDAQFVVEAAVEDLAVKQELFERLGRSAPADAILATNTSGLSVGDIAEHAQHPERVVGSHFFYPPAIVSLVEVGYGRQTADEVADTTVAFWKRCGKDPVVCRKDVNGFLVNRIQSAIAREAMSIVSRGIATPQDVDRAIRLGIGARLALVGILEQRDWGGLDVHCAAARSIYPTLEDAKGPLPIIADKVARGELGAKTGKGFYDWTGKDAEAIRRRKQDQLIALISALKTIMPEEEDLIANS